MCGYKVFYNAPTLRIHFVSASLVGRGIISRTQAQCSYVTSGLRFRSNVESGGMLDSLGVDPESIMYDNFGGEPMYNVEFRM